MEEGGLPCNSLHPSLLNFTFVGVRTVYKGGEEREGEVETQ